MSAKHTPGPWHSDPDDGFIYDENGTPLGQVFDNPDSGLDCIGHEQSDYNRELIASAPALLALVQKLAATDLLSGRTDYHALLSAFVTEARKLTQEPNQGEKL